MDARELADEMATEWFLVPAMPSQEMYDRSWRNIVSRALDKHGQQAVAEAGKLIPHLYKNRVPGVDGVHVADQE